MYALNIGAVETSTEEARNSSTSLRLKRTRSESVLTDMPGSTLREQAGANVREPSNSTTHTRHTLTGVRLLRKHSVGVSMPSWRAASRMVGPSGTEISWPSILMETERPGRGPGACGPGPGGTGTLPCGASGSGAGDFCIAISDTLPPPAAISSQAGNTLPRIFANERRLGNPHYPDALVGLDPSDPRESAVR